MKNIKEMHEAAVNAQDPNYQAIAMTPVSYTHLRAHETVLDLVCRLLLEKITQTPQAKSV